MYNEAIYEDLKKNILHLDLKPGVMISEMELCEKYKVSRTPIRDVIKKLESEDLLEVKPQRGSYVSLIDLNKVSDTIFIRLSLELAIFRELFIHNYGLNELLPLQQLLATQARILKKKHTSLSILEFTESDNAFHSALYALANRRGVWQSICSLNQHYQRFRTLLVQYNSDPMESLYEQHVEILDNLINKDWDSLEKVITGHITGGFQRSSQMVLDHPEFFSKNVD